VSVKVTDKGGLSATQNFMVAVVIPNRGPTITSTPVTGATAGQPYAYDVEATDPDAGDVLTYSLVAAPQGLTIDAATGLIAWTPTEAQAGAQAGAQAVTSRSPTRVACRQRRASRSVW